MKYIVSGFALAVASFLFVATTHNQTALVAATASITENSVPVFSGKMGVVNFRNCLENSKVGKREQVRFEEMRKEMEKLINEKEKELNDLAPKISDEYIDTLSPKAGNELKQKFEDLSQEVSLLRGQYYHTLSQANGQIMQKIIEMVSNASAEVAKAKGLDILFNEDACFFYNLKYDVSKEVVSLMDRDFDKEQSSSGKKE